MKTQNTGYALSVRQPWAELLLRGQKTVEYRGWPLPEKFWGRWLILHASQSMSTRERALAHACFGTDTLDRGGYVGRICFDRPVMRTNPPDVRAYCPLPYCWHWPVRGIERMPFCQAKGRTRVFKVTI